VYERRSLPALSGKGTHGTRVPKKRQAELVLSPKTPRLVPAIGPSPTDTVPTSHLLNTSLFPAFETPPSWASCSKRIHQLPSLQNPFRQRCRNQLSLSPSRQTATSRDNRSRPPCHIRRWHLNTAPLDRRTWKLENRGIFRIPLPGRMPACFL
jgi:hypothetical protein